MYPLNTDWAFDPSGASVDNYANDADDDMRRKVQRWNRKDTTVDGDELDENLMSAYRESDLQMMRDAYGRTTDRISNDVWMKGRCPIKVNDILSKHPRPINIKCQKGYINLEVLSSIPKPFLMWDAKLRAVQKGLPFSMPHIKAASQSGKFSRLGLCFTGPAQSTYGRVWSQYFQNGVLERYGTHWKQDY